MSKTTDFGYQQVPEDEKSRRVAGVFDSVAARYDLMNDLMSGGTAPAVEALRGGRRASSRPGARVLDVAGGTGDLARLFARRVGAHGEVVLTDVNAAMLEARARPAARRGLRDARGADATARDCRSAPDRFDCVSVAFGLRNMTRKEAALAEMRRVLKPGGRLLVLEFSRVWRPLAPLYDAYSFQVLPRLGKLVANDAEAYRYLAESIRVHPGPGRAEGG